MSQDHERLKRNASFSGLGVRRGLRSRRSSGLLERAGWGCPSSLLPS